MFALRANTAPWRITHTSWCTQYSCNLLYKVNVALLRFLLLIRLWSCQLAMRRADWRSVVGHILARQECSHFQQLQLLCWSRFRTPNVGVLDTYTNRSKSVAYSFSRAMGISIQPHSAMVIVGRGWQRRGRVTPNYNVIRPTASVVIASRRVVCSLDSAQTLLDHTLVDYGFRKGVMTCW